MNKPSCRLAARSIAQRANGGGYWLRPFSHRSSPISTSRLSMSLCPLSRGGPVGDQCLSLCLAAFLLVGGATGDQLGRRRVFIWIIDHLTWHSIFLINPFLAGPALWIAWRHLPESYDPEAPPGVDWLGSLLAFGGIGCVAFGRLRPSALHSLPCRARRPRTGSDFCYRSRLSAREWQSPWPR
jgi:hypothetical protein